MNLSSVVMTQGDKYLLNLQETGKAVTALKEVWDGRISQAVTTIYIHDLHTKIFKVVKYDFYYRPDWEVRVKRAFDIMNELKLPYREIERRYYTQQLGLKEITTGLKLYIEPWIYLGSFSKSDDPDQWTRNNDLKLKVKHALRKGEQYVHTGSIINTGSI